MRFKAIICLICWLAIFKHITFIPAIDWEEHEITGFEFKINFKIGKGE